MTLHAITRGLAVAAMLLGAVHLALAPLAYKEWSLDALWFVGAGLAIIAAAAINLAGIDRRSFVLAALVNSALALWFAAAWLVLPGPQVIVGGLLFAGLTCCNTLATRWRSRA